MNKLRAALLCLLILAAAVVPGGCWDAHEINSLSIVSGVGVDPAEEPGEFNVTVQIRKVTKANGGEQEQPFLLLDGTGKNVLEALDQVRLRNNRDLFLHQNQAIIISQDQAALGIRALLDIFLRYHETRLEVWVIVSECSARDLLQIKLVQEPVTASALALMMQQQSDISPKLAVNMLGVTEDLLDASSALVVPMVGIIDEFGTDKVVIKGSAVIVSDRMVGHLTEDETMGYAIGSGPIQSGLLEVSTENGTAVLYISSSDAKMKTSWADGHIRADISVDASLSVAEITGFEGQSLGDVFTQLESAANKRMVELISEAFEASRSLDADIFGIGSAFNRTDPRTWSAVKDGWPSLYTQTELGVTVKGWLLESGKISDALTMRGEE
jgi:spore germination protein KC